MKIRCMKMCIVLVSTSCSLFVTSATAQDLHFNLRGEFGGLNGDYPSCHGTYFGSLGGSAEIGNLPMIEVLYERLAIGGGEQCLPGRSSPSSPSGFAGVLIPNPEWRASLGIGTRIIDRHVMVIARGGEFLTTDEPFISGKAYLRMLVFTVGFEIGGVRARWEYEDGFKARRWAVFSAISAGLRL